MSWATEFYAGKTVVVTGGTSGIGAGIGAAFAEAGATVYATGATQAEVDAAIANGGHAHHSVLDVRSAADVEAFAAHHPKVHALINCAGVNLRAAEWTNDGFDTVIDINLQGSMRSATAFRKALADGGAILNIASMFAFFGAPHAPAYAASKHAVAGLTKSLAKEIASRGITVNAVAPGFIDTDMTRTLSEEQRTALTSQVPMARLGSVDDIAAAVLYLCSPGASYVTGETLHVNGGMYMA